MAFLLHPGAGTHFVAGSISILKLIPNIETPGTDPKYFQLAEIRRVKLSSILCDNSDDIENIQVKVLIFIRTFLGSNV